jgi:hypothetical protein
MKRTVFVCTLIGIGAIAAAETLPVTADAVFTFNGEEIVISRNSTPDLTSIAAISEANTACPAPCLSPMIVAESVATLGELDVIEFLSSDLENGDGLLVDARLPDDRIVRFTPGSVNIPSATVSPLNPYRDESLMALGAEQSKGIFDFENALKLVIVDGGPATQDTPALITDLLDAGYPSGKIAYYRGSMQVWTTLGLSTIEGVQ